MNENNELEVRELEISEGEYLTTVFQRNGYEYNAIPSNCIFDKTLPGLGATYSEIFAKRNSIIIEPNIPVIDGKVSGNSSMLGVYENCNVTSIEKYLKNKKIEYKKIICTPEGYIKVKKAAEDIVNLFEDFFMLFDECEKITQDIDYREAITLPINDFFQFRNKAFVSATPLYIRNPDFKKHGFIILKIKPLYSYKKAINLITTNHYDLTVISILEKYQDSDCICIFMNSTNGISKLINHLEGKGIKNYKAFSSKKSEIKLKERAILKSYESLDLPLDKYNFFTSRFFSAVDFYLDKQPDIIILTDWHEARYSKIDPFTNTIQIYGRFRNVFPDGRKFRSLTHISNYADGDLTLKESEILSYIKTSEKIHKKLKGAIEGVTDIGVMKAITDSIDNSVYSKFLNKDGTHNYFKTDNFFDDERVKSYYLSPSSLYDAYCSTNHFYPINFDNYLYIVGSKDLLEYKSKMNEKQRRIFLVKKLDAIYNSVEPFSMEEITIAKGEFLCAGDYKIQAETKETIEAYELIGGDAIREVNFSKTEIKRLVDKAKKEASTRKMFSKDVRETILSRFPQLNFYLEKDVLDGFKAIFREYGITNKVNIDTIRKFYGVTIQKGKKKEGLIKLNIFTPDFEYD